MKGKSRKISLWKLSFYFLSVFLLQANQALAADEKEKIRIGFFPNVTHAQALIAKDNSAFEKATGLEIEWVPFNAGPSVIEAIFADEIDLSFVGPNPAVNGYVKSQGQKFVIVAGVASGGAALVTAPHSKITEAKDFADKTVATPQLGNTQDVAARIWLAEQGHKTVEQGGSLTIQPLANPDQLLMFQQKQIDAAWTIEPWVSRLEQEVGGKVFLDEASLWPDGNYVTTHIIVQRKFLEKAEVLEKLLEAHVKLTQEINAKPEWAAEVVNRQIKELVGKELPPAVIASSFKRVKFTWDPIASSLKKSAEDAKKIGFLAKEANIDGIYDLTYLNRVLKKAGLSALSGK